MYIVHVARKVSKHMYMHVHVLPTLYIEDMGCACTMYKYKYIYMYMYWQKFPSIKVCSQTLYYISIRCSTSTCTCIPY